MRTPTAITLRDDEEIIWQGRAQFSAPSLREYMPLLIPLILLVNSIWLLYPAEPFIMLHDFCSGSFIPGLLILFTIAFAVAPQFKRWLFSKQTYLFTNRRAICYTTSTGCIVHTLPADDIQHCTIQRHGSELISILTIEQTGGESSATLLFARIPAAVLSHYEAKD